jgi:LPS sulfotransferase NodH
MVTSPFLILSTQRSGSTLIRTSLASHPDIQCFGEIFLPGYTGEYSFDDFLRSKRIPSAAAFILRPALVNEHLNTLYRNGAASAVGFKVMYNQIGYRPYRFPTVMSYARRQGIRILHLIRENPLNTIVSRWFAQQTKQYHTENLRRPNPMPVDVEWVIRKINQIEKVKAGWRKSLVGTSFLEVSYESFVGNKKEVSGKMLQFLDVDPSIELDSPLRKVLNASLNELITNYDALASGLKRAGMERFLLDAAAKPS